MMGLCHYAWLALLLPQKLVGWKELKQVAVLWSAGGCFSSRGQTGLWPPSLDTGLAVSFLPPHTHLFPSPSFPMELGGLFIDFIFLTEPVMVAIL